MSAQNKALVRWQRSYVPLNHVPRLPEHKVQAFFAGISRLRERQPRATHVDEFRRMMDET